MDKINKSNYTEESSKVDVKSVDVYAKQSDKNDGINKSENRQVKMIYHITEKDWLEINKLFYKIYGKKRKIILRLITILTFILFAYRSYSVFEIYNNNRAYFEAGGSLGKYLVNVGILFLIFIWMLWMNLMDDKRGVKKSYRQNKAAMAECELTLDDDGATSERESTSSEYKWDAVENAFVFNNFILIMLTKNQGYFLKREDINEDDSETLMNIINDNCKDKVQFFDK
ncbi:YcxB family protein [Metaclostridioides mangenotii]|uniref:Membrane protein n=1 Tax=Metaclostridioides mangenotii TaxID=1540 RepID=A0ABS4ED59_9FIRM|nr:YcxB family protein [Clostridioides mangenotii]MBP1855885.1 putative membrane protein [Clostridioides mangenotii]